MATLAAMFEAVEAGDLARYNRVRAFCVAEWNLQNAAGWSLYHAAAARGHSHMMERLYTNWERNFAADHIEEGGHRTAGMLALENDHLHAYVMWLHHGGNPILLWPDGATPPQNDVTSIAEALAACPHADKVCHALQQYSFPSWLSVPDAVRRFFDTAESRRVSRQELLTFVLELSFLDWSSDESSRPTGAGVTGEETKAPEPREVYSAEATITDQQATIRDLEAKLAAAQSEAATATAAASRAAAVAEETAAKKAAEADHVMRLDGELTAARADAEAARAAAAAMQQRVDDAVADAGILSGVVLTFTHMVSHRQPWPSGVSAEAVASLAAGLSSPTTCVSTLALLSGLYQHSPSAVMDGIAASADAACDAVAAMCQATGAGGSVRREAGLLAWLVAQSHKRAPDGPWPSMTRVIGSLYGVFQGTVEHGDPSGVVARAALGAMTCELGAALGSNALDTLMDMHPEAKYRLLGYLTEDDMMIPREGAVFYDGGRGEALQEFAQLCEGEYAGREVIVVDPGTDGALSETMAAAVLEVGGIEDTVEKATALAKFVQERLGGNPAVNTTLAAGSQGEVEELCMGSRRLPLGDLTLGVCRHRAIMYKLLADQEGIGISCRLVRGAARSETEPSWASHAWNVVSVETTEGDHGVVAHEYFVVDLMQGGALVRAHSDDGVQYKRSGGGTVGGVTLFGGTSDITVEEALALPAGAKLGDGSFGSVYKARDNRAVKIVAVGPKLPLEYAMREVKVMATLRHQNLMPLHNYLVSPDETKVCIVMPRGDGSLQDLVGESDPFSVLLQVAMGMQHLHGSKRLVVHRDLKPSNIILFRWPGSTVVKIADFGFAKVSKHGTAMSASTKVCTPGYAAPEQRWDLRDWHSPKRVSTTSDVFAFGQVMGFVFCGEEPTLLPPPAHRYTDIQLGCMPQALKDVYHRCTEADPGDRLSFDDVVDALLLEVVAQLAAKARGSA